VKVYFEHFDIVFAAAGITAHCVLLVGDKALVDDETLVYLEVLVDCELLVCCGEDSTTMRWIFGIATSCCW
jgi:hypothetical protein